MKWILLGSIFVIFALIVVLVTFVAFSGSNTIGEDYVRGANSFLDHDSYGHGVSSDKEEIRLFDPYEQDDYEHARLIAQSKHCVEEGLC